MGSDKELCNHRSCFRHVTHCDKQTGRFEFFIGLTMKQNINPHGSRPVDFFF